MKEHIYADNAATTKLDKVAFETMIPWLLEEYGKRYFPKKNTPPRAPAR